MNADEAIEARMDRIHVARCGVIEAVEDAKRELAIAIRELGGSERLQMIFQKLLDLEAAERSE